MSKLILTKEQKNHLTTKYGLTPTTLSEVINFKRLNNRKHAEIRHYACNVLGASVFLD